MKQAVFIIVILAILLTACSTRTGTPTDKPTVIFSSQKLAAVIESTSTTTTDESASVSQTAIVSFAPAINQTEIDSRLTNEVNVDTIPQVLSGQEPIP